jgi:hypothetical protein
MNMASIYLQDDGEKYYQKKKRCKRRSGDEVIVETLTLAGIRIFDGVK